MGGGIRPESPKVATRRRAESRRARSAVQRETTERRSLIHQPRLSAPVQLRCCPPLHRTEPGLAVPSSPRPQRIPPLLVTTSIIFSDQASDLRANASGKIQSAPPSMDTAGQNPKVLNLSSSGEKVFKGGIISGGLPFAVTVCLLLLVMAKVMFLLLCVNSLSHSLG